MTATFSATDQCPPDTHAPCVGGGPNLPDGQVERDTHRQGAVGDPFIRNGQLPFDAHSRGAVAEQSPEPAKYASSPIGRTPVRVPISGSDHGEADAHMRHVAAAPTRPVPATALSTPIGPAPVLDDPLLALSADVLDDLERVRIANENRLRQLTRDETDADGEERGFGLTLDHPDVKRLALLVEALAKAEHQAQLNLERQMRAHPLGPWVKQARGVGAKQAARLIAAIGDPYWNDLHERPRLVSELWSYCGYGDASRQVRKRGEKANWSADAKMRAYLVANSIVKAGGPYREVYDDARARYADSLHPTECKRCGPAGKPALAGSPRPAGHQHAMALRAVSKAVLRDLWREAKRLHGDDEPPLIE